jgi:DNA-binding transcriptional regulator LsrR (DeoR family)
MASKNWVERRQMVRAAHLYYEAGMTQSEVAKRIGLSRPLVSKLLQKARDTGIVEITIKDDTVVTTQQEEQLERRYDLREAIVVPVQDHWDEEHVKRLAAKTASLFLKKAVAKASSVGISWGSTLYHFVEEFPYAQVKNLRVYPLIGGMGRNHVELHSNSLAQRWAHKLHANCEHLYAPAILPSESLKEQLLDAKDIRLLLREATQVDLAVVGLGDPYDSTMAELGYLTEEDIAMLRQSFAVGDINSRFINEQGEEVDCPLNDRVVGITIDDMRKIETLVCIATGIRKEKALAAALKGGYIDILVVDSVTAHAVLHRQEEVTTGEGDTADGDVLHPVRG